MDYDPHVLLAKDQERRMSAIYDHDAIGKVYRERFGSEVRPAPANEAKSRCGVCPHPAEPCPYDCAEIRRLLEMHKTP
jgi:hypothetical protein